MRWTPTLERRNHLGDSLGIVEYISGDYVVRANYLIGGSWSAYKRTRPNRPRTHPIADIVTQAEAMASCEHDAAES